MALSDAGSTSITVNRSETPPDVNLLDAYDVGRNLNELEWNVEIAYLTADVTIVEQAKALLRHLSVAIRPQVNRSEREPLMALFVDGVQELNRGARISNIK